MTEFVRVRVENGSEVSVPAETAEAFGLKPLKKPATYSNGDPLPAKHNPLSKSGDSEEQDAAGEGESDADTGEDEGEKPARRSRSRKPADENGEEKTSDE